MNKRIKFCAALLYVTLSFMLLSCKNDDEADVPAIDNVFTHGLPKEIDGYRITTNSEGKVIDIRDDYEIINFKYGNFSRNETYQVVMTRYDVEWPDEITTIYMKLNDKGFVDNALMVDYDGEEYTWDFRYNSFGQLNYMKSSKGGNVVDNVTYVNGDITNVAVKNDNSANSYAIAYTNDSITTAIDNRGSIMFFNVMFRIDMYEMGIAYYAGLLGKATKHLPLKWIENNNSRRFADFVWKFNDAKLPIEVQIVASGDDLDYPNVSYIKW